MRRSCAGFTLLELVLVLFILAVTTALVFPRFVGVLGSLKLRSASRLLAAASFGLRQEALMTRQRYRMIYQVEKGSYEVVLVPQEGEPQVLKRESLPSGISFLDVQTPTQGKVKEGEASGDFFPGGYVEETTIHLTGPGNRIQTLIIKPFALGVDVLEGYVEQEKKPF